MTSVRVFAVLCLTGLCFPSYAGSASRQELIERLSRSLGLEAAVASARSAQEQAVTAQIQSVLTELRKSGLPAEADPEITSIFRDTMAALSSSWDTKEAARIYTEVIAESLSDKDIKDSLAFYESDKGNRANTAIASAAGRMATYISSQMAAVAPNAMQELATRTRAVVLKYKPKPAPEK